MNIDKVYLGYFFQFKPVETLKRSSSYKPANYTTPYYRSEVSLKKNDITGLSQHETLTRLGNSINNALVYYACAMLFDLNDIYKDPDLNMIKFVEVSSAPTNWTSNERHFITFQTETDRSPLWCSDPIITESINLEQIIGRFEFMTASNLISFLDSVTESIGISKYPQSLTILEFDNGE